MQNVVHSDISNRLMAAATVRIINRELSRRLLKRFTNYTKSDYEFAPHHELMIDKLQAVADGKISRLYIGMPPRHGKSELVSVRFPAYFLGRFPHKQIIHISYAASLSNEFSRQVRAIIRDDVHFRQLFPHVKLHPDKANVADWKTTAGGGFLSLGVQGGVTGHGADLLLLDDPHKEGDADSPATLEAIRLWYVTAARTRLMPGAAIVFAMTRWSPDDLMGQLLDLAKSDPDADQWEQLVLPALALKNDPLGRPEGTPLWEARYNLPQLKALRAQSARQFDALFQQMPRTTETTLFPAGCFKRVKRVPRLSSRPAWTFDLALTAKETSDYNCWARWHYDGDRLYCEKHVRKLATWAQVKREIKTLVKRYPNDDFVFPQHTIELMTLQSLQIELRGVEKQLHSVEQPGDKRARAQVYADLAEGGKAYVCDSVHAEDFIVEHEKFDGRESTATRKDDFVDVSSVATHWFGIDREFDALVSAPSDPVPAGVPVEVAGVLEKWGMRR